ncbi:MAG: lipoprotein [Spongiibacteraceae bacterium]
MRITALVFIVALGCGLAGCGQKGPLYLPSDPNPPAAPR